MQIDYGQSASVDAHEPLHHEEDWIEFLFGQMTMDGRGDSFEEADQNITVHLNSFQSLTVVARQVALANGYQTPKRLLGRHVHHQLCPPPPSQQQQITLQFNSILIF